MTTARQIESNRRNSQHSTGPKTPEGKEIARQNSLKHGCTGEGVVVTNDEDQDYRERMEEYLPLYPQLNPAQYDALSALVRAGVRLNHCYAEESQAIARASARAQESWTEDRTLEVEKLAARLNKKPELTAAQLGTSYDGSLWKCNQWKVLAAILLANTAWKEEHKTRALDLLGFSPVFRDGPTPFDPPSGDKTPEAIREHRLKLVNAQIDQFEQRLSGPLARDDEFQRRSVVAGHSMLIDPGVSRMQRYIQFNQRQFDKALVNFQRAEVPKLGFLKRPVTQPKTTPAQEVPATEEVVCNLEVVDEPRLAESSQVEAPVKTNPVEDVEPEVEDEEEQVAETDDEPISRSTTVSKTDKPKMNRHQRRSLAKKRRLVEV